MEEKDKSLNDMGFTVRSDCSPLESYDDPVLSRSFSYFLYMKSQVTSRYPRVKCTVCYWGHPAEPISNHHWAGGRLISNSKSLRSSFHQCNDRTLVIFCTLPSHFLLIFKFHSTVTTRQISRTATFYNIYSLHHNLSLPSTCGTVLELMWGR